MTDTKKVNQQVLSKVRIYKDTPLQNPLKTIHFKSNQERDLFFDTHYTKQNFNDHNFNVGYDRYEFRLPIDYSEALGYNYLSYKNSQIGIRYCRVIEVKYIRPNLTAFRTMPDVIMDFTQGDVLSRYAKNVMIDRQHVQQSVYGRNLIRLKTNDDILKSNSHQYVHQSAHLFKAFSVVFTIASDLEDKFGTVDEAKYQTSSGGTYDGITSPLNLYVANSTDFRSLNRSMKAYPWIWEEIKSVLLIPTEFMDATDYVPVKIPDLPNAQGIFKFKDGTHSTGFDLKSIDLTLKQISDIFGVDLNEDEHLLRSGYCNIEGYDWGGQQVSFRPEFLNRQIGFQLHAQSNIGYNNDVRIFCKGYRSDGENSIEGLFAGQYLNNAFIFNTFNDIPVMVDSYLNAMAHNSNRRQLAEDRLLTNRIKNVKTGDNGDGLDRVMNAASLVGTVLNPKSILTGLTDEYEFYRDQKAEFADMALNSPSITAQTNANSFQIANGIMGVTIKFSRPSKAEMERFSRYYKTFGFDWGVIDNVDIIDSMSIMNYLKISGSWFIPNVEAQLMDYLRSLLNMGVQFWHNNGTDNPMTQNLLNNKRIK